MRGPSPGTQTHVRPLSSRGLQIIHRDMEPVATTATRATAEGEPSTCTEEPTIHCLHRLCGYWLRCTPLVCCADLLLRNSSATRTRCFAPVGSIVLLFSGDRCIRDYVYLRNHSHELAPSFIIKCTYRHSIYHDSDQGRDFRRRLVEGRL